MKNETIHEAIPLKSEEQKKNKTKKILITIGIVSSVALVIWLIQRTKQNKSIIILAELLPLLEV